MLLVGNLRDGYHLRLESLLLVDDNGMKIDAREITRNYTCLLESWYSSSGQVVMVMEL